jgi:hypothetical protein
MPPCPPVKGLACTFDAPWLGGSYDEWPKECCRGVRFGGRNQLLDQARIGDRVTVEQKHVIGAASHGPAQPLVVAAREPTVFGEMDDLDAPGSWKTRHRSTAVVHQVDPQLSITVEHLTGEALETAFEQRNFARLPVRNRRVNDNALRITNAAGQSASPC